MTNTSCPQPETLGKYVLGTMDPVEMLELEKHLIECQKCCAHAETLNPRDEVTQAFGLPGQSTSPDDALIADVIRRAFKLRSAVSETTLVPLPNQPTGSEHPHLSNQDPLNLLSPPHGPDELGRLGDYRVLKTLGSGGMGFVFLAEDERLRRRVALKVMKPMEARKAGARERFLREARATAAVEHDNVIIIHQVGEDRGIPFIAMPMLQGASLKTILERESKLPQDRAVVICRQAAAGLSAAHKTGLIHRDIKPDNLWIESTNQRVKILDFGLVRELGNEDGLTIHGMVLGTPSYMSPEQAAGKSVDHRSDLFSLGAVLYQMLSGRSPFAGDSLTSTLLNVSRAQPVPIQNLVPGLDSELVSLVGKLHAQNPNDRPQSADEVVRMLEGIESRWANTQAPSSPSRTASAVGKPKQSEPPPKSPWLIVTLAGGAAAALLFGITFIVQLGKYQVKITLDDPSLALKIDGEAVLIEDGTTTIRLSAGTHKLTVQRDGLTAVTEEFTVEKQGKNVLHVSMPGQTSEDPDRRAATWMRSQSPPFAMMLALERDLSALRIFTAESTEPLPAEPFRIIEISLQSVYTDRFQDETAMDLANHIKGIRGLTSLRFGSKYMTSDGLGKLLEIPELKSLAMLAIAGEEFDDRVFPVLAKCPRLTNVDLASVPRMTGVGISALAACPNLTSLGWTNASPSVDSMEELSNLKNLKDLLINSIPCTEQHVKAIAKTRVRNLAVYNSNLDDAMVKHLAAMTQMEYLNISNGQTTDAGLLELRTMKSLKRIDLLGTRVTAAGVAEFQQAIPQCQILSDVAK